MKILFPLVCLTLFAGHVHAASLVATEIASRLLTEPDSLGNVYFAVRAKVTNTTGTEQQALVPLQGVDKDGFEIIELYVKGIVPAGKSDVLSERKLMPHKMYLQIVRWKQKSS